MELNGTIGTLVAVAVLLLGLVALSPFVRAGRRKAEVERTTATIDLLKSELDIERSARQAQEIRCAAEIAELRGRVDIMTEKFAKAIAAEVAEIMGRA